MMIKKHPALSYIFWSFLFLLLSTAALWADDKDFTRVCPTLQDLKNDGIGNNCLLCGIYRTVMNACAKVVTLSWNAFASPLQGVIAVAASIYVAVYTLKNIASFSQQDSSAYLSNDKTGIIPLLVKAAAVVWLLGNQSFIYGNLISPVITTGLEIGAEIGGNSIGSSFGKASDVNALFNSVINKIQEFNDEVYIIIALGRELLCLAFLPDSIIDWYFILIPFGAVLYVFGWFILIGISFYLLDVLFRLAVGCMLLPMAIACGFSKFTSNYTKSAWNLFVNVFFNFVMLGILLRFTLDMIAEAVAGKSSLDGKLLDETAELHKADVDNIVKNLNLEAFILTTICCMVAFKLFMEIEQLADKVSSAHSVGKLGQKAGGIVGSTAKAVALKPISEMGKFANTARLETGKSIAESRVGLATRRAGRSIKSSSKRAVKRLFKIKD